MVWLRAKHLRDDQKFSFAQIDILQVSLMVWLRGSISEMTKNLALHRDIPCRFFFHRHWNLCAKLNFNGLAKGQHLRNDQKFSFAKTDTLHVFPMVWLRASIVLYSPTLVELTSDSPSPYIPTNSTRHEHLVGGTGDSIVSKLIFNLRNEGTHNFVNNPWLSSITRQQLRQKQI